MQERKGRITIPPEVYRRMLALARQYRREQTPSEKRLWGVVRNRQVRGLKIRRQQTIGPFIADFYCPQYALIIEVDGLVHETQREHDAERQHLLECCGFRVFRLTAELVETDLDAAVRAIIVYVERLSSPSPLDGEGAGG